MFESTDRPPTPGGSVESGRKGQEGTGLRPSVRTPPRAITRELKDLVPADRAVPTGSVDLRSGSWHWTLRMPRDGDPVEGSTLLLTDPSDPRRRMEVRGLPGNGVSESEVPYFARRCEVRWVPAGPGEYVVRVVRLPIDLATPFGTRIGLRIRVLTPAGGWREGSLAPGIRLGDLTDEEVCAAADRARPVPGGGFSAP
jgi:hypothetical protein